MSSIPGPDSLHPGVDLRHMTSNTVLGAPTSRDHRASHRVSQHLRMSPARSPTSIPSSPTSVHSSSSAIFERDIEPISPRSPSPSPHGHGHLHPSHPPNPHRIPRSKTTEQLEHSVPSVLDAAAAILAEDTDHTEHVSVLAPAPASGFDLTHIGRSSGFASPIGSFRSRSPSPTVGSSSGRVPQNRSSSLLLSIPGSSVSASPPGTSLLASASAISSSPPGPGAIGATGSPPTRPVVQTAVQPGSSTPSIVTPTSAYFSTTSSDGNGESPTTTTREHVAGTPTVTSTPAPAPTTTNTATAPIPIPAASTSTSHPPSPILSPAQKRLSFMSYSDLLTSTPASALPLSALTTSASAVEPPPHIPSVSGLSHSIHLGTSPSQSASAATSLRGFVMGSVVPVGVSGGSVAGGQSPALSLHVGLPGKRDSIVMLDDVGGEWEREGMGMGLEERLEIMVGAGARVAG
ncbi:hypothetical protein BDZ94DRAFT_1051992 [Collybia nuda]|uniref:Uncharacterized protein n=1 Tax=Collybia nuda TaxID=64659 RepID=A0A9P5Y0T7_9AGAR|nr:hypothetical protein BDZ94DRAFT_1051992 [Collybia nuda]